MKPIISLANVGPRVAEMDESLCFTQAQVQDLTKHRDAVDL
jgi:hypothetical protein